MKTWLPRWAAVAALTAAACTVAAVPAGAASPAHGTASLRVVKTLSSSFVGPLQFAVDDGHVFVADSFTSTLSLIGRKAPIATGGDPKKGGDVAGVALDPARRSLAYTTTNNETHSKTTLTILRRGAKPVVANLSAFESRHNPDHAITYGTTLPGPASRNACITSALAKAQVPLRYRGGVDSHPYAVAAIGDGAWAVADAGGNDILKVDRSGHVSLLSVLPAQPLKITAAFAASMGLPACVVGITYKFEAVPTDVEVGPGGALFVTTLPGGPGNIPGSVYRIDRNGHAVKVATGFAGATNLAIDGRGNIYVAQIGNGTIARVVCGKPQTVIALPGVVAVEYDDGHLYASTSITAATEGAQTGPGTVVELG